MKSEFALAIVCPFCGGQHEVAIAKNGRPYASCGEWMNRIFGNSPASLALFQNGSRIGANYSQLTSESNRLREETEKERRVLFRFEDDDGKIFDVVDDDDVEDSEDS